MNKVFLIGNLTRDPELMETANGVSLCRFSLAVGRSYTVNGERETDFFNCTAWRGTAENIAKYTTKGAKVCVTGSVQIRQYEDNEGVKRTAVDIICQEVEFISRAKSEDGEREQNVPQSYPARGGANRREPHSPSYYDDDIPF